MARQVDFMKTKKLGFDREQVVVVPLYELEEREKARALDIFKAELSGAKWPQTGIDRIESRNPGFKQSIDDIRKRRSDYDLLTKESTRLSIRLKQLAAQSQDPNVKMQYMELSDALTRRRGIEGAQRTADLLGSQDMITPDNLIDVQIEFGKEYEDLSRVVEDAKEAIRKAGGGVPRPSSAPGSGPSATDVANYRLVVGKHGKEKADAAWRKKFGTNPPAE